MAPTELLRGIDERIDLQLTDEVREKLARRGITIEAARTHLRARALQALAVAAESGEFSR